jgi:hypothetical protein
METDHMYTLKGHHELKTSDGYAMAGWLCCDGVKIATYEDGGYGGEMRVDYVGGGTGAVAAEAALIAHLAALPPMPAGYEGGEPMAWDVSCFIGHLADAAAHERRLNRLCMRNTVFTVPGDPEGELHTLKVAVSDKARAFVLRKYPGAVILNDRVVKKT